MLELIVFAVVFVALQGLMCFVMFKCIMSEKFIKKYSRMTMKVTKELVEEFEDEL